MGNAQKAADGCLAEVFGFRSRAGEILSGRAPIYESNSEIISRETRATMIEKLPAALFRRERNFALAVLYALASVTLVLGVWALFNGVAGGSRIGLSLLCAALALVYVALARWIRRL